MKMKRYKLVQTPFLAFFSKKLYRDIGYNWGGLNLAYLFLVMAVCCIPPAIALRHQVLDTVENLQLGLIRQIPEITIHKGHARVDQTAPIFVKRKDGSNALIIDTTGSMNFIDDPETVALLTEHAFIVRRDDDSFNTFDLSGVTDLVINQDVLRAWINRLQPAFTPLIYALFLTLSYVSALAALLLAAFIGLILSNTIHGKIGYGGSLRIATVAATPAILLLSSAALFGMSIPGYVYPAVALVYLVFGIFACTRQPEVIENRVDLMAGIRTDNAEQKAA